MSLQENKPKNLPELDQTLKLTLRVVFQYSSNDTFQELYTLFTDMD